MINKKACIERPTFKPPELWKEVNKPLLTIELEDIDSIPKIKYKGERITGVVHAGFDWVTKNGVPVLDNPVIELEYLDKESKTGSIKQVGYNSPFNKHKERE
ncbi:hypothetical protein [Virgibacillus salexigens]|uniref:Uncharacterized protein n=1 Tax=Virgibacillus kapii TaxID=1638645 RepID=A0ABQ2D9J6_9BACI|nr:hypothetical protein [Virgibacillus kapii]GGJ48543.1 hypothetical protein GCM10007111_08330 [Virgibacillus kapii]